MMFNSIATPSTDMDYECVTNDILEAALHQASILKAGAIVVVSHQYKHPDIHDNVVRLLLAVKSRKSSLRYQQTLFGQHTFLVA